MHIFASSSSLMHHPSLSLSLSASDPWISSMEFSTFWPPSSPSPPSSSSFLTTSILTLSVAPIAPFLPKTSPEKSSSSPELLPESESNLAYEYGKKGAFLVIGARREDALRQVAERAVSLGSPRTIPLRIDVSRYEECRRLIEEAVSQFGRLDHLVISAGVTPVSLFEGTFDVDNFSLAMDTNFWGVAYTIYFAAPYLRTTRGKIVAISSSTSWLNAPRLSFYNASKAAVVSFLETLRVEFGSEIGITLVTPGLIESEVTKGKFLNKDGKMVVDQDMRDVVLSAVPIEKVERCAKAVVASACRGDKYLTWPPWMSSTLLVKSLCPEVLDWFNRWYLLTEPGVPPTEAISKKVADLPGLKDIVWPDSVQSPKIKTS